MMSDHESEQNWSRLDRLAVWDPFHPEVRAAAEKVDARMTPDEFKAWFDGLAAALDGPPNADGWAVVRSKVALMRPNGAVAA
jgi:hypothetical protein